MGRKVGMYGGGEPKLAPAAGGWIQDRDRLRAKKRIDAANYAYPSGWEYCRDYFDPQRFRMIRIPSMETSSSAANHRGIMGHHPLPGSR